MPNATTEKIYYLSKSLGETLKLKSLKLATAESCTGGWIAQVITDVPGSSAWFDRGFVTYSNEAKVDMLDVKTTTLDTYGAVSKDTALEMAKGALSNSIADISVSATGIAGPEGGSIEKPIGTVWIGYACKDELTADCYHFEGDRSLIREKTVIQALKTLIELPHEKR